MRRPIAFISSLLPRGIGDALLQFFLFFLAYNGYQLVRGISEGREAVAFANAERLVEIQQGLGAFFEPSFQQALVEYDWLINLANFLYMNTHFVVTTAFLVWLYLFRNDHFYFVRNMFMVAMGLALIGYALYPTAPPRLMPELGFTDTIHTLTGVAQDAGTVSLLVNQYAAVPSMHIAFALMIAVPGMRLAGHPLTRALWSVYPLLVFFVIVVTANHFWLDAAAGAAVACFAAAAATQLARAREAWEWPQGTREATA
ncbi:MAG TPA: phosphatase PAP2 family protein [Solirubrobacterales bacterium]|nr:phosphatase PAP2 family protein [Solirubrobacterales bacterium]